jgi:hypothetical protein
MDIEILDSYPTIEILGILYTSAQKQKANNLHYSALTRYSTIVFCTIRYVSYTCRMVALRNPVTSN